MRSVEAIISKDGKIRLLEPIGDGAEHRAIVVLLDEVGVSAEETAALSEQALRDWSRPEEDGAWSHLQPAK
jgi:hypothetical protein